MKKPSIEKLNRFKVGCWRILFRILWTRKRTNSSIKAPFITEEIRFHILKYFNQPRYAERVQVRMFAGSRENVGLQIEERLVAITSNRYTIQVDFQLICSVCIESRIWSAIICESTTRQRHTAGITTKRGR